MTHPHDTWSKPAMNAPQTPSATGSAKGYWIAHGDVRDLEQYQAYVRANAASFRKFGARFLVRGGPSEVVEGSSRSRHVVLEFPSLEAARACWHSQGYQAARALRQPVSEVDLVIVGGYEGPQPGDAL
jgi:uncharacterized protein (DUF1330 family)